MYTALVSAPEAVVTLSEKALRSRATASLVAGNNSAQSKLNNWVGKHNAAARARASDQVLTHNPAIIKSTSTVRNRFCFGRVSRVVALAHMAASQTTIRMAEAASDAPCQAPLPSSPPSAPGLLWGCPPATQAGRRHLALKCLPASCKLRIVPSLMWDVCMVSDITQVYRIVETLRPRERESPRATAWMAKPSERQRCQNGEPVHIYIYMGQGRVALVTFTPPCKGFLHYWVSPDGLMACISCRGAALTKTVGPPCSKQVALTKTVGSLALASLMVWSLCCSVALTNMVGACSMRDAWTEMVGALDRLAWDTVSVLSRSVLEHLQRSLYFFFLSRDCANDRLAQAFVLSRSERACLQRSAWKHFLA